MKTKTKSLSVGQLEIPDNLEKQDYIFHCKIVKKKLIGSSNRYLFLFENKIIINKVG